MHDYPAIPSDEMSRSRSMVEHALDRVPPEAKAQAYQAWLGYYNSNLKALHWSQSDLVTYANDYARDTLRYGPEPPELAKTTVGKMGLKGVKGLRFAPGLAGKGGRPGGPLRPFGRAEMPSSALPGAQTMPNEAQASNPKRTRR